MVIADAVQWLIHNIEFCEQLSINTRKKDGKQIQLSQKLADPDRVTRISAQS